METLKPHSFRQGGVFLFMKVKVSTLVGLPPVTSEPEVQASLGDILRSRFLFRYITTLNSLGYMPNVELEARVLQVLPSKVLREFKKMEEEGFGRYVRLDPSSPEANVCGGRKEVFAPIELCNDSSIIAYYDWETETWIKR